MAEDAKLSDINIKRSVGMKGIKRMVAKKVRIADIVNGRYYPGSKETMQPSYVITPLGERVSRASIVATVVDKFISDDESYGSLTVDDGTEAVRVKVFGDVSLVEKVDVGDLVLVIGKVKEYGGELYVNGEIVRKAEINYELLRRLEVLDRLIEQKRLVDRIKKMAVAVGREELEAYARKAGIDREMLEMMLERKEVDYKPKILEVIESLDEGEGVEISKLFEFSKLPERVVERAVDELLASGELYEPKVGFLKKV